MEVEMWRWKSGNWKGEWRWRWRWKGGWLKRWRGRKVEVAAEVEVEMWR